MLGGRNRACRGGGESNREQPHLQDVLSRLCAFSSESCPTLCDPRDCCLPGPSAMGFLRQEYWKGLLFPPPGDLPDPGIDPGFPASPALAGRFFTTEPPGTSLSHLTHIY